MIAPERVKMAALLASVMHPRARRALIASLPSGVAERIEAEAAVVRKRRWDIGSLVTTICGRQARHAPGRHGEMDLDRLVALSRTLDSGSYSRLVVALGMDASDFLFSLIDVRFAERVRRDMRDCAALAPAVREAVVAAAHGRLTDGMPQ
ncbi:hypothetical protein AB8810_20400 [Xanthomonas sp. NCPPB 3005]|uniref:hypothetical protein n=1 Tax=Xanthomonas sp. NCPPB 3005 TaxID=3240913 RepID=UPI003518EEBD